MHLHYSENGKVEGRFGPTLGYVTMTLDQNENRSATVVTDLLGVVGTGVDPVTFRFSGGRSAN